MVKECQGPTDLFPSFHLVTEEGDSALRLLKMPCFGDLKPVMLQISTLAAGCRCYCMLTGSEQCSIEIQCCSTKSEAHREGSKTTLFLFLASIWRPRIIVLDGFYVCLLQRFLFISISQADVQYVMRIEVTKQSYVQNQPQSRTRNVCHLWFLFPAMGVADSEDGVPCSNFEFGKTL